MNIRIVQRKDRIYGNGESPLFIRFTHERKSKFISLGVSVPPEHWDNDAQTILDACSNIGEFRAQINAKLREWQKKILKLEALEIEVTFETLFEPKGKRIACTIEEYFTQQIKRLKSLGKVGTASKYEVCLKLLKKSNRVDIRFDFIDMQYLKDFELFLSSKGNVSNSIATKFSVFKALYNHAISDGVFTPNDNPFTRFKVGKYWKPTRKRAISKEDILKLKEIELPEDGNSFSLAFARDIFLFSYYTAGINFKDIATLRHSDIENGRIYYARHKTSKEMSCHLMPEAKRIIDTYCSPFYDDEDYIFPILDRQIHETEMQIYNRVHKVLGNVNANLKTLSKMIGLKTHITSYTARHTYATVLKRSGVNIAIISESLGHSDLATTQIYLDSFENSQIDEAMKNLI